MVTRKLVTDFQQRVYDALGELPAGYVTTYDLLCKRVGCGSPRAIGQALRQNPFAPDVPCHRVIRTDLRPGGFMGSRGGKAVAKKLRLLAEEDVVFSGGVLADTGRVWAFVQDGSKSR